jgi:dolichol-phosphate mannosyltransferase
VSRRAGSGRGLALSVVMPVYNEGVGVIPTIESLESVIAEPHELLVVYDFDEDTTVPVITQLASRFEGVRAVRNEFGRGVLNAIRAGFGAARAPYVLVTMADGSDDYAVLPTMLAAARQGADVVAASRYMRGGHQYGGPLVKRTLSRAAGVSLHRLAGVGTHDATNNYKLYSKAYLESITIESRGGFELALELTVKASRMGRRVVEVPAVWRDRTAGASRFRLRAWLPQYLRWYLYAFRPHPH